MSEPAPPWLRPLVEAVRSATGRGLSADRRAAAATGRWAPVGGADPVRARRRTCCSSSGPTGCASTPGSRRSPAARSTPATTGRCPPRCASRPRRSDSTRPASRWSRCCRSCSCRRPGSWSRRCWPGGTRPRRSAWSTPSRSPGCERVPLAELVDPANRCRVRGPVRVRGAGVHRARDDGLGLHRRGAGPDPRARRLGPAVERRRRAGPAAAQARPGRARGAAGVRDRPRAARSCPSSGTGRRRIARGDDGPAAEGGPPGRRTSNPG